jgi:hypothetical protein
MKVEVESIYSGFMGFPYSACMWDGTQMLAWSTNQQIAQTIDTIPPERVAVTCAADNEKRIRNAAIIIKPPTILETEKAP